jgi:hypothetical protein
MPPRPPLPADDLYARLGVPRDASPEAIALAWRGLLRKHHPDIAGPEALELAKRINVAHDWLSDPDLRRRYDRERGGSIRSGRPPRGARDAAEPAPPRPRPHRPPTMEEQVAAVVERIGRLTRDDLDRLARAELSPIAFLATLRRFVDPGLQAVLDEAERAGLAALPRAARKEPAIRDAITARLADIVLGDVLDELLGDPAGARARERLTRGWDAAVGQPRYGPSTAALDDLLARLRALDPAEVRGLAATGTRDRLGDDPWPDATSRDEDEALRVSSELAADDAEAALGDSPAAARRAVARIAHLLVLRHAFAPAVFDRHAAPWLGTLIPTAAPTPHVRPRR